MLLSSISSLALFTPTCTRNKLLVKTKTTQQKIRRQMNHMNSNNMTRCKQSKTTKLQNAWSQRQLTSVGIFFTVCQDFRGWRTGSLSRTVSHDIQQWLQKMAFSGEPLGTECKNDFRFEHFAHAPIFSYAPKTSTLRQRKGRAPLQSRHHMMLSCDRGGVSHGGGVSPVVGWCGGGPPEASQPGRCMVLKANVQTGLVKNL